MDPADILVGYSGYDAKFSLVHALDCKNGGLISTQNNDLRYGVSDLYRKVFPPFMFAMAPLLILFFVCRNISPFRKISHM